MRILLILLLCSSPGKGQTSFFEKDSSVVRVMEGFPAAEPFDTANAWRKVKNPYVYVISDNDLYNLFGYAAYIKHRDFDFGSYHILGTYQCRQCMLYCRHDEGRTACHRNRCQSAWVWMMRDNAKALTEIPSTTFPGHIDAKLPEGRKSFLGDTIITQQADTSMANWYTHGGGDCHARFEHSVFADKYHPVLLLKQWNFWGGCRAGGSWNFTVSFRKPEGILHYKKNIILMEKYKKW